MFMVFVLAQAYYIMMNETGQWEGMGPSFLNIFSLGATGGYETEVFMPTTTIQGENNYLFYTMFICLMFFVIVFLMNLLIAILSAAWAEQIETDLWSNYIDDKMQKHMSLELANMTVEKNFLQRTVLNMLWRRQAEGVGDDGGFIKLSRRNQNLLEVCREQAAVFLVIEKHMSKSCRAAKLVLGVVRKDFPSTNFFLLNRNFDSHLPEGLIVHRALQENDACPFLFIINAGNLTTFPEKQFTKSKMGNFIAGCIVESLSDGSNDGENKMQLQRNPLQEE